MLKRGDRISVVASFKDPSKKLTGKIVSATERTGYFKVRWEDGRTTFINKISSLIQKEGTK